jgi:hypothetical protein
MKTIKEIELKIIELARKYVWDYTMVNISSQRERSLHKVVYTFWLAPTVSEQNIEHRFSDTDFELSDASLAQIIEEIEVKIQNYI